MLHLRTRLTIAVAAVTVGALLAMPAGAHEIVINDTVFDGAPTVTVDGSAASVHGLAIFGGERAKTLATDPVGDDRLAEGAVVTATDLTAAKISQPEPVADELLFQLDTAGAIPVVSGTPEAVQYNWDIAVDGGAAAGGSNWTLKAMRSSLYSAQSTDAWASLNSCVPSTDPGTAYTCTNVHTFDEVEFERTGELGTLASRVRIFVPFDVIGVGPGSTIDFWSRSTNPIWTGPSASGRLTLANFFDSISFHQRYVVPVGGVVHLASGQTEDPDALDWSTPATVDGIGNFSGSIELAPEDTVIGVRACFSDNCAYYFTARS